MKGQTMKLIHHFTGEWVRPSYGASVRTDGFIHEYDTIEQVSDPVAKRMFLWMIEHGEIVTSSGSHIYQIRQG
jgi:hypothetical protein